MRDHWLISAMVRPQPTHREPASRQTPVQGEGAASSLVVVMAHRVAANPPARPVRAPTPPRRSCIDAAA